MGSVFLEPNSWAVIGTIRWARGNNRPPVHLSPGEGIGVWSWSSFPCCSPYDMSSRSIRVRSLNMLRYSPCTVLWCRICRISETCAGRPTVICSSRRIRSRNSITLSRYIITVRTRQHRSSRSWKGSVEWLGIFCDSVHHPIRPIEQMSILFIHQKVPPSSRLLLMSIHLIRGIIFSNFSIIDEKQSS